MRPVNGLGSVKKDFPRTSPPGAWEVRGIPCSMASMTLSLFGGGTGPRKAPILASTPSPYVVLPSFLPPTA